MKLSVVILNYNVRWFLRQCVYSVQKALDGIDSEIIVVDNASPDDSCAMMRELFPEIKLIASLKNTGFPKGNNLGVAAAAGEYLCILNPDTVVAEDSFRQLIAYFESLENPGIIGPKLIDGAGKFLPESKRGVPMPWVAFTKTMGLYKLSPRLFGKYYWQHLGENQSGKTQILVGAFLFMKRELYNELGGFDEDCFMYADDIDLCYRALKLGRENYYFAGTTAIHYKGESTVRDGVYMKRFRDAMLYFYRKHFSVPVLFRLMMNVGILVFSVHKKNLGKGVRPDFKWAWLVSADKKLRDRIGMKTEKSVEITSGSQLELVISQSISDLKADRIFFDPKEISFDRAIKIMEALQTRGTTFRFAYHDHFIGSDNSVDRGELVRF